MSNINNLTINDPKTYLTELNDYELNGIQGGVSDLSGSPSGSGQQQIPVLNQMQKLLLLLQQLQHR
jgi:hypothetical protein